VAKPRKVGKRWRIELQVNGQKLSSYHDTRQAAANWATEQEVVNSAQGFIRGRTMDMLFDRYADEVVAGRKGERWDRVRIKNLSKRFGATAVMGITARQIELWRDERLQSVQPSSFNRELNLLSAILSKAVKWRWLHENPVKHVERPKDPPHRERIISDNERDMILGELKLDPDNIVVKTRKHELGVVFLVALTTAMRLGEITGLRWEYVHLSEKYCHLPDTKNGTSRNVPLSTKAVSYIGAMGQRESGKVFRISRDIASNYFRDARRAVGIDDIVLHDARHTAITRMADHLTPLQLARAVGHKKLDMTLRYYNAHASDLADLLG